MLKHEDKDVISKAGYEQIEEVAGHLCVLLCIKPEHHLHKEEATNNMYLG